MEGFTVSISLGDLLTIGTVVSYFALAYVKWERRLIRLEERMAVLWEERAPGSAAGESE